MKSIATKITLRRLASAFALALLLGGAGALRAQVTGTWINTTDTTAGWSNIANWSGGTTPGSAVGDVANFTANLTTNQTVTLDGNRTLGTLNIGDSGGTLFNYTLSGNTLTFAKSNNAPTINLAAGTGAVTIASDIVADGASAQVYLHAITNSANPLVFSGTLNQGSSLSDAFLYKEGTGTLAINQTSFRWIYLVGGTLKLSSNNYYTGGTGSTVHIDLQAGTTLDLNGTDQTLKVALTGSVGSTVNLAGGSLGLVSSAIDTSSSFTGAGTLAVTANSSLNLRGDSPMTGTLIVDTSTVSLYGSLPNVSTIILNAFTGTGSLRLQRSDGINDQVAVLGSGGGNLLLQGFNETIGSLGGSVGVTTGAGTLTVGAANTSTTNSGTLNGNFVKTGTGTQTISGNGSAATWNVSQGTLQLGASNALSSSNPLTIASGATLDANSFAPTVFSLTGAGNVALGTGSLTVGGTATTTFSGVVSGTGSLIKSGTGTLILDNTSGGSIISAPASLAINGGTVQLVGGHYNALLNTPVTVAAGGTLDAASSAFNAHTLGAVTLTGGTLTSTAAPDASFGNFIFGGNVAASGGTTSTINAGVVQLNGVRSVDVAANSTLNVSSSVRDLSGGAGGLTKTGAGTLSLSGANTYTLGTAINGGTLSLGASGALGTTGTISFGGGALQFGASNNTDYSARFSTAANQAYSLDTNGQNVALATALTSNGGSLAKSGTGSLTLSANNTFTGATTINAGTLALTGSGSLYSNGTAAGAIAVNSGGTLAFGRDNTLGTWIASSPTALTINAGGLVTSGSFFNALNNLALNGGELRATGGNGANFPAYQLKGTVSVGGSTASTITTTGVANSSIQLGSNTAGSVTTFNVADATASSATDLTVGAALADGRDASQLLVASGLTKTGAGTMSLSATNTYTGPTNVTGGTLILDNTNTGGATVLSSSSAITVSNATVQLAGTSVNAILNNPVTLQSGGSLIAAGSSHNAHTLQTLTLQGGTLGSSTAPDPTYGHFVLTGTTAASSDVASTISAGEVQLNGTRTFDVTSGTAPSILNVSSNLRDLGGGAGGLVKTGVGTLVLSGTNTYTLGTTISGGTLQIGAGGASGSVAGSITDNAALAFNRSDAFTHSGVISGTGGVTKLGGNTLTLSGANTYSGATTISAGTLQLGANTALGGSTAVNVASGATFDVNGKTSVVDSISGAGALTLGAGSLTAGNASNATFSGVISGTGGSLTKTGSGALTLTGANTYSGGTTISAGTLIGSTTSLPGNLANNAALTFDQTGAGTFGGTISGTGALTKTGSGTLTLSGANTYTGGTTISTGSLQGSTTSLTGSIANNAALAFNQSTDGTFSGVISGSGALVKSGGGTVTLTGGNSYSGGTTLAGGTLVLGHSAALGTTGSLSFTGGTLAFDTGIAPDLSSRFSNAPGQQYRINTLSTDVTLASALTSTGGSLAVSGAAALTLTGTNTYDGGTTVSDAELRIGNGGTTGSITGDIATVNSAGVTFNRSDDTTFAGAITGNGAVLKLGAGTLTLTGTSTFTGGMQISAGTVQLGNSGHVLPDTGFLGLDSNTKLVLGAADETVGNLTGPGTVDLSGRTLTLAGQSSFLGLIQSTGGGGAIVKTGSNTVLLGGDNTYSGGTTINAGTLSVNRDTNLGAAAGTVAFGGGTLQATGSFTAARATTLNVGGGTFDLSGSGTTLTWGGNIGGAGELNKIGAGALTLSGTNTYSGGTSVLEGTLQIGSGGTSGAIAGDVSNHASLVFNRSDASTFAGVVSGPGSITKLGAGTLTLTATNTYSGATSITAGQLKLNGSAANSAFTVSGGGILSGNGTVGALTIASGGILSPGNSPGTMNATNGATFNGGGTFAWQLNSVAGTAGADPGWDLLNVTGGLTINATSGNKFTVSLTSLTLGNLAGNVADFNAASNYTFPFVTTTTGVSGFNASAFTLDTSGFSNPFTGSWSIGQSGNNLTLNYSGSAIPEPSTYATIFGAAALGVAWWRKRRAPAPAQKGVAS